MTPSLARGTGRGVSVSTPTAFEVWADLVIPTTTAVLTLLTATKALVIAARANGTAESSMALQERLYEDATERDLRRRRLEVGTAVRRWHEYALLRALRGKGWSDAIGAERAERWKILLASSATPNPRITHALAADLLLLVNAVGRGKSPPPDMLGRLAGVSGLAPHFARSTQHPHELE